MRGVAGGLNARRRQSSLRLVGCGSALNCAHQLPNALSGIRSPRNTAADSSRYVSTPRLDASNLDARRHPVLSICNSTARTDRVRLLQNKCARTRRLPYLAVRLQTFPNTGLNFPVTLTREIRCKSLTTAHTRRRNDRRTPTLVKFPFNFPVSREFGAETRSISTVSSASQSGLQELTCGRLEKARRMAFFRPSYPSPDSGIEPPEISREKLITLEFQKRSLETGLITH